MKKESKAMPKSINSKKNSNNKSNIKFLKELNDIEQKFLEYDNKAFFIRGGREKSPRYLYNKIMRHSYKQLIDILLYNMMNYYKPEHSETPTNEKTEE